ncbi:MAG: FAD-binding domain [Hyphomicrobiaceae bacterium]|nr:FAD-binding domain [Hyphomicrobiaceae bacterium]
MRAKTVVISGAGIAGPTLAYWLADRGFEPTLVERASQMRSGGYIIDFWGAGYDVAEKMGLLPEIHREGYDVGELRLVDTLGGRVGGFSADVFRRLTNGRYVSIARSELARLLFGKIEGRCEAIFGDSVTRITPDGDGVSVAFEKARERRFDLAIGADGLHSRVRELVFGAEDTFEKYLGYMVGAFQAEGYGPREDLVYVSYTIPGKQVARFAMRGDRTMFLFVLAADEPVNVGAHDIVAQRKLLHTQFDEAGWESSAILRVLDSSEDLYFDRVSQIHMEAWSKGRVALVGDAAYCASLLAGQGSALAMVGAYVLAGELGRLPDDPEAAFARYERLMRPFIAKKQKAAVRFAASFAPRTQFGVWFRNQITSVFGIPFIARLFIGPDLLDRIDVPDYTRPENQA